MKIAYVSSFDATDIKSYSGTGYYIPEKLKENGHQIQYIGNLSEKIGVPQKVKRKLYCLTGKKYIIDRNPHVLKKWGNFITRQLNNDIDLILGYSSQPFARLNSSIPKVFWADAVFANMVNYYPVYTNLCKETINDGNAMEKAALENCNLAILSSDWAAEAAVKYYGISESKIKVIPYGANIETDFSLSDIERKAAEKSFDICRLLFIGVEWYRKGGDIAVEAAKALNDKGIKTILSIVGVDPGEDVKNLDFVNAYGFISKSTNEGQQKLNQLISESHFLILPTRADCTPIVFNEFNAHGIPVITTREGGVPTIIKDGVNGLLFEPNSKATDYASKINEFFKDKEAYVNLSKTSFVEYTERLNWKSAIDTFHKAVKEIL